MMRGPPGAGLRRRLGREALEDTASEMKARLTKDT